MFTPSPMRLSLLGLALFVGTAASAQSPIPLVLPDSIFYADPGTVAGRTADLPVLIGEDVSGRGISSVDIVVSYDPAVLTITGSTLGSIVPSGCLTGENPGSDEYRIGIVCGSSNPLSGGPDTLLTLQVTFVAEGDSDLTLTDTTPFNEGDPEAAITDGRIRIVTDPRPGIGAVDDQTVEEDGSVSVDLALDDPDTPFENLTVSAEAAPALVAASGVSVAACDGQTLADPCRTLTLAPEANANGAATVTVTVSDGDSRSDDATTTFGLTITPVNDAPTVASPIDDLATPRSDVVTIPLADVFADVDGDALTYSATSSDTGVLAASVEGSTLTLTPGVQGDATVTVQAADGEPLTVDDVFEVSVLQGVSTDRDAAVFALLGARPNPTTEAAVVAFDLPAQATVRLDVFDVSGRAVYTASETMAGGSGRALRIPSASLAPGVYAYRLVADVAGRTEVASGRLTVAR